MSIKLGNKDFGKLAEKAARDFYLKKGFKILATNWHSRFGEIDFIAEKNKIIYFVEVKARNNKSFGWPEEALTKSKLNKILLTAYQYLETIDFVSWQVDLCIIEKKANKYYLQRWENVGY